MFGWLFGTKISEPEKILNVGKPTNVVHNYHVFIDPHTKKIIGLPRKWENVINETIPVDNRPYSLLMALKTVEFLENGVEITDDFLFESYEYIKSSLPTKKLKITEHEEFNAINIKNLSVDEILNEIRKFCFHEDSKSFQKFVVKDEVGEGASGNIYSKSIL